MAYSRVHLQVPMFWRRQVFVNWFPAMKSVPSGTEISLTNMAQLQATGLAVGAAGTGVAGMGVGGMGVGGMGVAVGNGMGVAVGACASVAVGATDVSVGATDVSVGATDVSVGCEAWVGTAWDGAVGVALAISVNLAIAS